MTRKWADFMADQMTDLEFAAAYEIAKKRQETLIEQPCSEGCCVEFIDPETGESDGGWGPVGCPCGDSE